MSLFEELRRRNVIRVAAAYLVGAWLVLQITDVLLGNLAAPDWVFPAVLAVLAVGMVLAVFLAWVYELTPEGVVRSDDVEPGQSITPGTGRRLNIAIIGMLAIAVVVLLADKLNIGPGQSGVIEKSIAVLPLRTLSSIVEDDYFADGIHDDLLTQLAKLSSLDKVISRTSTERYRDTTMSMKDIGDELDVATILEGGVQRSGSRVRINMQLIDAETDEHLWAKTYERELTAENLFAIQSEITREVVSALHAVLSDEENQRISAAPTKSLEAHREYALGHRAMAKRTGESIILAKQLFESAVALDPEYADAWVGLADSLFLHGYANIDFEETVEQRRAAIDTALALDPTSGKAYTALAALRQDEDTLEQAEEYYLKAIELNPNYASAFQWYGLLLDGEGRPDEALPYYQKAVELDPLAPVLAVNLANGLWNAGRLEDARSTLKRSLSINRDFSGAHAAMGVFSMQQGRLGDALRWYDRAVELNPDRWPYFEAVCSIQISLGLDDLAEICVEELEALSPEFGQGMRLQLFAYQQRFAEAEERIAQMKEDGLTGDEEAQLWSYYFVAGEPEMGISMLKERFPFAFENEECATGENYLPLSVLAGIDLIRQGEIDRGNALLDQCLEAMKSMNRLMAPGAYKDMDLSIHAERGDLSRARLALRDLIRERVIEDAWLYSRLPSLDELRADPEGRALLEELNEVVAAQRQWYLDHKDEPLF